MITLKHPTSGPCAQGGLVPMAHHAPLGFNAFKNFAFVDQVCGVLKDDVEITSS